MDNMQYTPPNGYDPYNTPQPQPPKQTGLAVASLVLGIISIVCSCFCVNVITAPLAIIFGIIALSKQQGGTVLSIAGIVTAAVSLLLSAVILLPALLGYMEKYEEEGYIDAAPQTVYTAEQIGEV